MAISAYTKTTWANSPATTSAVSAANLQHIEDQVKDITDAAVSGGASPTKIWTSTNDGNSGQQPAPKPATGSSDSDIKRFRLFSSGASAAAVLPAGGTWAYSMIQFSSSLVYNDAAGGVAAGGTTVGSSSAGAFWIGFIWRIA